MISSCSHLEKAHEQNGAEEISINTDQKKNSSFKS